MILFKYLIRKLAKPKTVGVTYTAVQSEKLYFKLVLVQSDG